MEAMPLVLPYAEGTLRRRRSPLAWRLGLTLACMYLPYAWLLFVHEPWNEYRRHWLLMWPILPGLSSILVSGHHGSDLLLYATMGMTTAALLALFLTLASRSHRWVPVPTLVSLALSLPNAWLAYAMFVA